MAETISLTKSIGGDYEIVVNGAYSYTKQFPDFKYTVDSAGVKLIARAKKDILMFKYYAPSEWTINGVSGFATIKDVTDAITVLDIDLKIPTGFTSAFTVDTILGQLNWTDANSGIAEYEVYSSTNGGADVLLATTVSGATSYQDTTCKQNASVVYKIRAKKGTKFSDLASATALSTPLCWKTNQSVLTSVVIGELKLIAGKTVNINWGDGTNANYSGDNINVTKNYSVTGQYNISITGDINFIYSFKHESQLRSIGVITNWILPNSLITASLYASGLTGNLASITVPASCVSFQIPNTLLSGSIPNIEPHATNTLNFQAQSSYFTDCAATTFRKAMVIFNIGNQNAVFPTANINKVLKALADWYQVNAPTSNCSFTLSGANMGIPTGGASNADITRLVGYYTAAGKSCTILVRTS